MIPPADLRIVIKLLKMFYPFKRKLITIACCLLFVTFCSLLLPLLTKRLIDEGIMRSDYKSVLRYSIYIAIAILINSALEIYKEKIRSKIASGIYQKLLNDAFSSLLHIKIAYFNDKNSAEIHSNLEVDTMRIGLICDSNILFVVTQLLSFIGGIIGLFIIDARMTFAVLLFFPIKFFIVNFLSIHRKKLVEKLILSTNKMVHWFGDNINGIKEIRLYNIKKLRQFELSKKVNDVAETERRIAILDSYNITSDSLMIQLLEITLYLVGTAFILNKSLTIGSLFAFVTYSAHVMNPFSALLNLNYMLSGILPSAERYFSLLETGCKEKELTGNIKSIEKIDSIEFKKVSFSYGENVVINDVSFEIKNGEHVALVGRNGTGKTTIFQLIERFIEPSFGQITIGGHSIDKYDVDLYRASLACMNQSNYLFDVPIIDNIVLDRTINPDALEKIIQACGLLDLKETFHESVGSNGGLLSGGQRQKVLLARMLLEEKGLYLFDEAATHLDTEAKKSLTDVLNTLLLNKTVFMIVHTPDILRYMDKIFELDGTGTIREYSSYEQFRQEQPEFNNFFESDSAVAN